MIKELVVEMGGDTDRYADRVAALRLFLADHPELLVHAVIGDGHRLSSAPNLKIHSSGDPGPGAAKLMAELDNAAFLSAGDTGSMVLHLTRRVGRIVKRPPILCSLTPKVGGTYITCDVGGGTLFPEVDGNLFAARCGELVARCIYGRTPKIGLFNVGEEYGKGGETMNAIFHALEAEYGDDFVGNVEPNHAMLGHPDIDVLATAGFIGNVFLKSAEAPMGLLKEGIRLKCQRAPWLIPLALLAKRFLLNEVAWQPYAGAYLIGMRKPALITHGRSDQLAFHYALERAAHPTTWKIWQESQYLAD